MTTNQDKTTSSMASSSSITGLHRRPVNPSSSVLPSAGGPLHPDVDPPPRPPRVLQLLAFVLVILLACLQFLPATHFRHHADPTRSWIPFDSDLTATTSDSKMESEAEMISIFSWTDCLNLRALAVLVNSTLSSSRLSEHVHFNFFVPEGEDEKVSYYKLKLLLPHSNLNIISQKEIKEKLRDTLPEWELLWPSLQLIPLIIPSFIPDLSKFIYVSSDLIVKGNIEDIFGVDLGSNGIAAAEDCTKRLGDYVKIDVVNAIQRTAAKRWVSDKPYDTHACIPDLNVILFDAKYLDKELLEAIPWWIKVLNLKDERNRDISPAIALALYNRYVKLPPSWKLGAPMQSKLDSEINILHYDGPLRDCLGNNNQHQRSDIGNIWRQYLPAKSDVILDH